jgi:hypothetical protein
LTAAARKLDVGSEARSPGPVVSRQQSKLFPALFQRLDASRRLTVLEIGPALPETVDFFSAFRCRLHFVDLFNEPFLRDRQGQLSEKELRHCFEERFRFPDGTRLDILLLWDFVSYLDDAALRALNSALRPLIHPGTRAHGFGVHHLAIKLENIQYGIIDRETFSIRDRRSSQMKHHPHSQVEMQDMFGCFKFERGLLLPNGKLEMLLKPVA